MEQYTEHPSAVEVLACASVVVPHCIAGRSIGTSSFTERICCNIGQVIRWKTRLGQIGIGTRKALKT
jgi:hypothetical protein